MIVIFHNPACSKSREALRLIRAAGHTPEVIEYLTTGWSAPLLRSLCAGAGLTLRDALKAERSNAGALGLLDETLDDAVLIEAMIAHPELVNRPFVVTPKGTALCRPPERVLDLL